MLIDNLKIFNIEFENPNIDQESKSVIEDITLIREIDYNLNRSMLLAFDIYNADLIVKILEKINNKSVLILMCTKENDLKALLSKIDMSEYINSVDVFFCEEINQTTVQENIEKYLYFCQAIQPVIKMSNDVEEIRAARKFLEIFSNIRTNYTFKLGNDLNDTIYGIRNRFLNLKEYVTNPGFKAFKEKSKGVYFDKPAVIVASGPSLDKNISVLKDYQKSALVLSCDGSMNTLRQHGILPDVIGSVERIYLTYKAFYQNIEEDVVFAGPPVVRPEIIDSVQKPFISSFKLNDSFCRWFDELLLERKGVIHSGTSVAHYLYEFAKELGCNPIILVGQDLAYSPEGVSHAGDVSIKDEIDTKTVEVYVPDYEGRPIPSTYVWKNFLIHFEDIVAKNDKLVVDATEGGAYIKGTHIDSLANVLERYCGEELPSVRSIVDEIKVDDSYVESALDNFSKGVRREMMKYEELLIVITKAIKLNVDSMERYNKGIETQEHLDEIYDAIEFVENEVVNPILRDQLLLILFQYPIYVASTKISTVSEAEYTMDNLKYNLEVHEVLLKELEHNTKKMLRATVEGICFNRNILRSDNLFEYIDGFIEKNKAWFEDEKLEIELA